MKQFYCYFICGNTDYVLVGKVIKSRTATKAKTKFLKQIKRFGLSIRAETLEFHMEEV